jgi:hypothetical protein
MKRTSASYDDQIADPRWPGQSHQACEQATERRAYDAVTVNPEVIEQQFKLVNKKRLRRSPPEIHALGEPMPGKIGRQHEMILSKDVDVSVKNVGRVTDAMDQHQRRPCSLV